MCTPIFYIHNITLWSCPEKIICPNSNDQNSDVPNISVNISNSPSPGRLYINISVNNSNVSSPGSSYYYPSPVPRYYYPSPRPSYIYPSPGPSYNYPSPGPSIIVGTTPSSSRKRTTTTTAKPTTTAPSWHYKPNLRHNSTTNSSTNYTGLPMDNNKCHCSERLDYLHIFWIIPLCCLIACCCWYRRRGRHKITNLYVAYKSRKLRRSKSWPSMTQLTQRSPIDKRSQSEPAFDSIVI